MEIENNRMLPFSFLCHFIYLCKFIFSTFRLIMTEERSKRREFLPLVFNCQINYTYNCKFTLITVNLHLIIVNVHL